MLTLILIILIVCCLGGRWRLGSAGPYGLIYILAVVLLILLILQYLPLGLGRF